MRYPNEATFCFVDGTTLAPLEDQRIGKTIAGRYEILEVLGEGGMSTVYRARHRFIEQQYAVKIMNPALARDATVRERFRREAKNAQKLAHPNIIEIFEQGDTEDGTAYMVMELLHGKSLAEHIAPGAMDMKRALGLMIQMGRGIARAHDLEVIPPRSQARETSSCASARTAPTSSSFSTSASHARCTTRVSPARASSSARPSTWLPSASRRWMPVRAPISTRWVSSSSRWSPVACRSTRPT